jgi:hypothetical protein
MRDMQNEERRGWTGERDWNREWEIDRERASRGYGMYGAGETGGYYRGPESHPEWRGHAGYGMYGRGWSGEYRRGWEPGSEEETPRWRGGYGPGTGAFGRGAWGQGGFGGGYGAHGGYSPSGNYPSGSYGVYGPYGGYRYGSAQDFTRGGPDWERGYGAEYGRGSFGRRAWGPYAGRGPRGYQRSDERIREELSDRLTDDPWIDASDIEVRVQSGVVTLTGQVENRDDKRRAEDIAEDISGVRDVSNQLHVERREGVMEKIGEAVTGREQG